MTDTIDIRPDGSIIKNDFAIGKISWDVPWVHDLLGVWFADDVNDDLVDQIAELESEVRDLIDEKADAEEGLKDVSSELEEAEKSLSSLRDEVRAFLAGGDFGKVATARLTEALEAAE